LLDPARYPFTCRIEPRFGDLDVNMHVNNVALMELAQEGRVRFHHASGYHQARRDATSMIASFTIEFLGEAFYPQGLDCHVAISRIGRTSHVLDQFVTQRDRAVAWTQSVIVTVGEEGPSELPDSFRESAKEWMLRT
jgi:acyl-CoA thioester hydrolase